MTILLVMLTLSTAFFFYKAMYYHGMVQDYPRVIEELTRLTIENNRLDTENTRIERDLQRRIRKEKK